MQITVKEVKVLKTGTNKYGDWKLVKVYTDKEEYTTLADDADQITKGSTINVTDMDEDEKGKKFKKFEIVAGGEKSETSSASQPNDNEYWERKQAIERASIEAQVAFKGMVELLIADKLNKDEAKATIRWAMGRIALPTVIVTTIEEAKSETTKDNKGSKATNQSQVKGEVPRQDSRETTDEECPVTNAGTLFSWIMAKDSSIKAPRLWVQTEFGLSDKEVITDEKAQALYKTIKTKMKW